MEFVMSPATLRAVSRAPLRAPLPFLRSRHPWRSALIRLLQFLHLA